MVFHLRNETRGECGEIAHTQCAKERHVTTPTHHPHRQPQPDGPLNVYQRQLNDTIVIFSLGLFHGGHSFCFAVDIYGFRTCVCLHPTQMRKQTTKIHTNHKWDHLAFLCVPRGRRVLSGLRGCGTHTRPVSVCCSTHTGAWGRRRR